MNGGINVEFGVKRASIIKALALALAWLGLTHASDLWWRFKWNKRTW